MKRVTGEADRDAILKRASPDARDCMRSLMVPFDPAFMADAP